ncbi:MAG: choice-of-anchor tandem repeat GloVer-containing protein, partial [Ferruginibacter sp.]
MKKIILQIICFSLCVISAQAQSLYGLTSYGGNDGWGALIKFIPATNNLTVAKSFESFAANPHYTNFIQASDGKLYGMTLYGGSHLPGGRLGSGGGAIFSFDPSTSIYTKLMDFDGINGANPYGSLVQASDGKLYGMTSAGGSNDMGAIFSFDPSNSVYTKLKDFDGTNGRKPYGNLFQASDGKLYGMTYEGGSSNYGVIFSYDPSTLIYSKLVDFDVTNGSSPSGSLMQASNGKLYGMTPGNIFSFDPSTSTFI